MACETEARATACEAEAPAVACEAEAHAVACEAVARAVACEAEARAVACEAVARQMRERSIDLVRIGWCDLHGVLRGKTLTAAAVPRALQSGVGMVSTVLLKDTSDRTAYRVFAPGGNGKPSGFGFANNLVLLPDPASFRTLPWAPGTGWMRAEAWFDDATPVAIDTRRMLRSALERLGAAGFGLTCGLEVEFHIYRLTAPQGDASLDPERAAWPGDPPALAMIHPGYNLLAESWADMADEPLRIVQRTAEGLGLPLASLEIELGPSQVEAVFDATDALQAADDMVAFRNGVKQALRRAGYHASFVCLPPFANVMASGWHLHQSLVDLETGGNAFCRDAPAPGSTPDDAEHSLSAVGAQWLAGLLAHGRAMTPFCAPHPQRLRPLSPRCDGAERGGLGAATTAAPCCACSALRATRRLASRTASASTAPTRTSTSPRRSMPASTASRESSPHPPPPARRITARMSGCRRASAKRSPRSRPTRRWSKASAARLSTGSRESSASRSSATTRPTTRTPGRRASTSADTEARPSVGRTRHE